MCCGATKKLKAVGGQLRTTQNPNPTLTLTLTLTPTLALTQARVGEMLKMGIGASTADSEPNCPGYDLIVPEECR